MPLAILLLEVPGISIRRIEVLSGPQYIGKRSELCNEVQGFPIELQFIGRS